MVTICSKVLGELLSFFIVKQYRSLGVTEIYEIAPLFAAIDFKFMIIIDDPKFCSFSSISS